MAKRIEFIAPFDGLRGNVSGRQDLVYAENDNKAFEAPQGRTNYARNYKPRYVSAKRARDGRMYFSVRTKNAVNLSARSMQAMALLGGTGAIYAAIVNNDTLRNGVDTIYRYLIDRTSQGLPGGIPVDTTFRKYVSDVVRKALQSKAATITFAGGAGVQPVNINNPWILGGTGTAARIAQTVFVQFWPQLASGGIYFYVDSQKGISHIGDAFDDIVQSELYNILGLTLETISSVEYVKIGSSYIRNAEGSYVTQSTEIVANARYTTTDIAPA